jgi:hypothetical protein
MLTLNGKNPAQAGRLFVEDEKKPPSNRASIRLWLAVLLSVAALWFVDAVLKPASQKFPHK